MSSDRWYQLMKQWDAPRSRDVYSQLQAAYSEPHRHYHNRTHIADCLSQFDEARPTVDAPDEVELALWFHDAVYKPTSSKNELRSAEWAKRFLLSVGASEDRSEGVFRLIMATRHAAESLSGDAAVVVDIDLSILGRSPERYDRYERGIAEEYKWVPRPLYRRKRGEILESFLSRAAIYTTEHFRSRYERQARQNLQRAIEDLRSSKA